MKKKWIQVTSKWSYLCFIPTGIGLLKILFYDITLSGNMVMAKEMLLSLLLVMIGIYLFIRMNSYSHLFNPNHPH